MVQQWDNGGWGQSQKKERFHQEGRGRGDLSSECSIRRERESFIFWFELHINWYNLSFHKLFKIWQDCSFSRNSRLLCESSSFLNILRCCGQSAGDEKVCWPAFYCVMHNSDPVHCVTGAVSTHDVMYTGFYFWKTNFLRYTTLLLGLKRFIPS